MKADIRLYIQDFNVNWMLKLALNQGIYLNVAGKLEEFLLGFMKFVDEQGRYLYFNRFSLFNRENAFHPSKITSRTIRSSNILLLLRTQFVFCVRRYLVENFGNRHRTILVPKLLLQLIMNENGYEYKSRYQYIFFVVCLEMSKHVSDFISKT